ncbi:MAG TPA: 2-keto-4-pentenoate hydratase [Gammaproteobacteria bacterium]|nr:2-keto-4-pentenoate hydratase [Gammaproteobacteria bacterium]
MLDESDRTVNADAPAIAKRLVAARLRGEPLAVFPGELPQSLPAAYAVQDAAIAAWPDSIAGWKVGLIAPQLASRFHEDRLCGPIFRGGLRSAAPGDRTRFPVYVGGFAAVEAEFLLRLGGDAPPRKLAWTIDEARELVGAVHVGIETAGSPLAVINEIGPCAIVSDFGNNAGLIVGPELAGWRVSSIADWRCETFVEGRSVGHGDGRVPPGGPFESLRFLLGLNARRGRPLRAGDWISTGAITGVHDIVAGQTARVIFDGVAELTCRAEPFGAAAASAADGALRC